MDSFLELPAAGLSKTNSRPHQTHQTRSPPRRPRSRNPSPHHISMTTRHTCWWIRHSQISLEGTSVCLREEIKEVPAVSLCSHKRETKEHNRQRWTPFLSPPRSRSSSSKTPPRRPIDFTVQSKRTHHPHPSSISYNLLQLAQGWFDP